MSRYEPLRQFLEARMDDQVPMAFEEIEGILRRALPESARRHQAWWANTASHSHAGSWLAAGYRTERLDIGGERVVFVREHGARPAPAVGPVTRTARGERLVLSFDSLNGAALRMIDDYAEQHDVGRADAAVAILNAAGVERRMAVLQQFQSRTPRIVGSDSVDLIREDRDAR